MSDESSNYIVSYAQNREDRIIEAFFSDVKDGFYVDVGANHPFYHSVTKIFYDKGWSGVNIEPNPMLFKQIKEQRKRDKNLMIGVGAKAGAFDLRVYHSADGLEGISTLSPEMKKDYQKYESGDTKNFDDLKIEVKTLKQIFEEYKLPHVHFIKIDVEGFEYEVLEGNDWKKYRPELICIEANHIMRDWRPMLKKADYELVFNDGLNDYYLAKESHKRHQQFDYAKVFLADKPIVGFEIAEKLRSQVENLKSQAQNLEIAEDQIKQLNGELANKQRQLEDQKAVLEEITPLKKHIKRQVKAHAKKHLPHGKRQGNA